MDSDRDTSKAHNYFDESIITTPLPQATSTLDKRFQLLLPDQDNVDIPSTESRRESGYLSDGILSLNKLREEVDTLLNNPPNFVKPETVNTKACEPTVGISLNNPRNSLNAKSVSKLNPPASQVPMPEEFAVPSKTSIGFELGKVPDEFGDRPVSLPLKDNEKLTDNDRRATFTTHDNLDIQRQTTREKALKALAYEDLHLGIQRPEDPNQKVSLLSARHSSLTFPVKEAARDMSGFSELLQESDLQRDEQDFAKNALPLPSNDVSLAGVNNCSHMTEYFGKGSSESFFEALGTSAAQFLPCNFSSSSILNDDENKFSSISGMSHLSLSEQVRSKNVLREINPTTIETMKNTNKSKLSTSSKMDKSDIKSHSIVSKDFELTNNLNDLKGKKNNNLTVSNFCDSISAPSLIDDSFGLDVPRVSEIAKVLRNTDSEATPISLVKKVLSSQRNKSQTRESSFGYSRDVSDCSSIVSLDYTDTEKCYEVKVVYGGGVCLALESQVPLKDCTWTVQKADANKVLYNIKQIGPSTVEIPLLPKVKENVDLRILELAMTKHVYRYHNISLIVEMPKVHFNGKQGFDFGKVSECTSAKIPFKLICENSGMVTFIPVISQHEELVKLEFDDFEPKGNIDIYPDKPLTGNLILSPGYGFCSDPTRLYPWQSTLKLCLSQLLNNEVICKVRMKAEIFKCSIMICMEKKRINSGEEEEVMLKSQSPCEITMKVTTTGRFIASASQITIPAFGLRKFRVGYVPLTPGSADGELLLVTVPGGMKYRIKISGVVDESNFKPQHQGSLQPLESYNKPMSATSGDSNMIYAQLNESRRPPSTASANSSMSLSTSGYEVDGPLQLLISTTRMIWPSRTVGCNSACIKSVDFRAKPDRREKLHFEVLDPTGSYQLVVDGKRKQSLVISVSQSNRSVFVDFTPCRPGQIKGQLIVKRFGSEVKEIIGLYGYGGLARLHSEHFDYDIESKSFQVTLDANYKRGQFTLQNTGDGTAFFQISLNNITGLFIEISPDRGLLGPGEKITVSVHLNLERICPGSGVIEGILKKNKTSEILLLKLLILFGDHPTRLRIARIYSKNKKDPQFINAPLVSDAIRGLCNMFPSDKSDYQLVNSLKDPLSSIWDLFETGINEWSIRVVIARNVLEHIILDSTQQFVSFHQTHNFDETECSTVFDPDSFLHSSQRQ